MTADPSMVSTPSLFADITNGNKDSNEATYGEEVDYLAEWCDTNNLLLNTEKLIVDNRRNADPHPPIRMKGTAVEHVNSFKSTFLRPG